MKLTYDKEIFIMKSIIQLSTCFGLFDLLQIPEGLRIDASTHVFALKGAFELRF